MPLAERGDRRSSPEVPVDWDHLPPLLKVWPEVAHILRVNRTRAYELVPSLPGVIRLGRRQIRVARDPLRRWLEGAAS